MKVRTASGKIRELSEKEITERIEKSSGKQLAEAWSGKDLAEVAAQSGMSRVVLLVWFGTVKDLEFMSSDIKNAFRDRSKEWEEAATSLKESNRRVGALMLAQKRSFESLAPFTQMDLLADLMMKKSSEMVTFVKKNGQKDGLDLLVREILKRNKRFKCWTALYRSLDAAGVSVSKDALRKKRDLYFDELGIEKEKRP